MIDRPAAPRHSRCLQLAAALLTVGALAACTGSSSGGGTPGTAADTGGTTTVTATATASGGSASTGYCAESQLRASIENTAIPHNNTHGEKAVIVDFTNTSSSSCVLYGYPGAAVLDSSGSQVKEAMRTVRGQLLGYAVGHNTLVRVTLQPGAVASAGIEGTNQQEQGAAQAGCDAAPDPRIEVTPPNTSTAVPFDVSWPICYSFTVHPVNYEN